MSKKRTLRRRYGHAGRIHIWVGKTIDGKREVFRSGVAPTDETHGHKYRYVIGPFRTVKGARFMADSGENNPHVQSVAQAEKIAAGKTYDIALGRWV